MELRGVLEKIEREHRHIKNMLIESTRMILDEGVDIHIKDRDRFINRVKVFLRNYARLVKPHFEYEEKHLFTALPDEYIEKVAQWSHDHRCILELLEQAQEFLALGDVEGLIRTLQTLYIIETRHTEEIDTLVRKLKKQYIKEEDHL